MREDVIFRLVATSRVRGGGVQYSGPAFIAAIVQVKLGRERAMEEAWDRALGVDGNNNPRR